MTLCPPPPRYTVEFHADDAGFQIRLPDGEIVLGPDGRGLTLEEADSAMEFLETRTFRHQYT